jgi:hypothetical protein
MSRESDYNSPIPATLLQRFANGGGLEPPAYAGNAYGANLWQQSIPQYPQQTVTAPPAIPTYQSQFVSPAVPVPPDYYDPRTDRMSGIYDLQRPPHIPVYLPSTGEVVAPGDYDYSKPLFQNADYNSIMLERKFADLLDYLKSRLGSYYSGMMNIPLNPQERQRYYRK